MMTAERIGFGMYAKEGIRKPKANKTKTPDTKKRSSVFRLDGTRCNKATCINVG